MKSLSTHLLLELSLRTSLEASNYSPGPIVHRFVESSASFRCLQRKGVVKIWVGMHGDVYGLRYSCWDRLELKFTLPDGKVLKLDTGYVDFDRGVIPLPTERLSPVTELLQECINQSMQGEKHTPKINNRFAASYFLHALGFSWTVDIFL